MKTVIKSIWFLLLSSLVVSCTEQLHPSGSADTIFAGGTKGPSSEYYYWYNADKIDLTLNEVFVNILVDTSVVKQSGITELCSEYTIEAKTELDKYGLFKAEIKEGQESNCNYQNLVEALRKDSRVLKVLPYFERGHGAQPIGTSHFFYVQLKDQSPYGTPFLDRIYDVEALNDVAEQLNIRILKEVAHMPDWYIMSIEGSEFKTSVEAANHFYETGRFLAIDPAFIFSFRPGSTNDPLFTQQWGLNNTSYPGYDINIEGAWAITKGAGAKIAIIDQGPDPNHLDLVSNYYYLSYNAQTQSVPAAYSLFLDHGTHVAGIAGAVGDNDYQIAGVAYESTIIRISHELPIPPSSLISSELASGISWAYQNGADVINCSWSDLGGVYYYEIQSLLLDNAINNAMTYGRQDRGSVVVFMAGNDGYNGAIMDYPANSNSRILTVGSIGIGGYRAIDSGYGPELDVVAPGVNILSTLPGNGTGIMSGTSMATPHVSGVAALVIAANPYLSSDNVVNIIQRTAKKISPGNPYTYMYYPRDYMFDNETWNQEVGYGLVDATAAVSMANAFQGTPQLNGTGMDVSLSTGPTNNNHTYTINGGPFPITAYANLLYPQQNSSYTYYWFVSTNAYPTWNPSLTMTSGSTAVINIPTLSYPCVLYIQCMIYNGSTLVDIPSYTINVNP